MSTQRTQPLVVGILAPHTKRCVRISTIRSVQHQHVSSTSHPTHTKGFTQPNQLTLSLTILKPSAQPQLGPEVSKHEQRAPRPHHLLHGPLAAKPALRHVTNAILVVRHLKTEKRRGLRPLVAQTLPAVAPPTQRACR